MPGSANCIVYDSEAGFGIFTGQKQVIYISVTRNRILETVHEVIWQKITPYAHDPVAYYTSS